MGPIHEKHSKLAVILGSIFGVVIPVLFCVCLVICCVAPCCLFYKKCRKRRNRTVTTTTTVVNTPLQPLSPSGYHPSPPAYQPVPVRPVFTGPLNPTAPPPSYLEANSPTTNPPNPGQPMGLHPSQPPVFDDFSQPPYNPTYGLNRQV
ncbi:protein shisa-5-like isoform X2 [Antennarius striatus]|uniref:protein shisa-5-like isoform X2 n=1 Tax=Antennarius striatus TaxID=241820 RepID=UPI0035AF0D84